MWDRLTLARSQSLLVSVLKRADVLAVLGSIQYKRVRVKQGTNVRTRGIWGIVDGNERFLLHEKSYK